jgi:ABC exporter DevB family membrane fusion protein
MRAGLLIFLLLGIAFAGWYATNGGSREDDGPVRRTTAVRLDQQEDNDELALGQTLRCQGKLEPASGLIRIVAPVGSRVSSLTEKSVGDEVTEGEVLVTLQSRDLRQQDLKLAQARRDDALNKARFEEDQGQYKLRASKLALAEAESAEERIATEEQKIELLRQQCHSNKAMLTRLESIASNPRTQDLLNDADLEKQRLVVQTLQLKIKQAELEVELARKSADRAQQAARNNIETIESSIANANQAVPTSTLDAAVDMAQRAFDMTEIKSPLPTATILDIIVREGDSVTNKPVMVIGDTSDMHCVAEVSDQFLRRVNVDSSSPLRARITSPALGKSLVGTVIAKGVMIGPPSLSDPNPFAKVDRRTGTVSIQLDDSTVASKLVNLQVEVEIELSPGALKAD